MRFMILTKRSVISICLCALLGITAAITGINTVTKAVTTAATDRIIPIYCVDRTKKVCAISFDAAWGNEQTDTLLDILDEYEDWQNDCQLSLFEMQSNESITQEEERILNLLTPDEPLSIDEIIYRLEQGSAGTVAGILLQLELQGLVQRHPSGGYTARR